MMFEFIKGTFCFLTFTSWAYSTMALIGCGELNIPYPDWFYPASAVAVVTFLILLGCLVYDILKSDMPRHISARARRRKHRCLGVVRYENGRWICVPDNAEDEEG